METMPKNDLAIAVASNNYFAQKVVYLTLVSTSRRIAEY
ncbi:hypothetical protein IMPR6_190032 [Imperialibacter sp. EC-SDR9]|nr:hypothetical protein IMPERIA89_120032 [Imperialibacter sp. 89]CAD5283672.1 hypothetical protein IMPERIA75_550032 [Imperialibacter sp. 75]VVT10551.1 hypothetical protein IMPR6_190032 [Imperialibacter sp. EC-SDR9]